MKVAPHLTPPSKPPSVARDQRAVALMEFAFILPILLSFFLGGAELMNYITTRLRVGQLALHIADNASRIGSGGQLQVKTINEADILDLFVGAQYQSGSLDLDKNGRVFLSSLEPVENPNVKKKYKIRWQRCFGKQAYTPRYSKSGAAITQSGMGDTGRMVTVPDGGQTMFVELVYKYRPLVDLGFFPEDIVEHASMLVRDTRDTTGTASGIYPVAKVTAATC